MKLPCCLEVRNALCIHLFIGALSATFATRTLQTVVNRRLREKCARTIFLQDTRPLILFLEAFEHLINRFVL